MDETSTFNLLEERWIPVLRRNGRAERVGIRTALLEAGKIRQIAASNPMDNVALLRFLLAVLMWCKPELSEADRVSLEGAAGVPGGWLEKLKAHKATFNLLGDEDRFYQDASLKGGTTRPIADLLVEFPGADSVNHMRHVVHDSYGFCPACCALGILRLSVWASANRHYPASVNPGSAAYAVIQGTTLLQTLFANRPKPAMQTGHAPWLTSVPPESPGSVAKLAWRPRRLFLNVAEEIGACANCGGSGTMVASLCTEGGWPTPTTDGRIKKFWSDDPHLLSDEEPISLPGLGSGVALHSSRFWRDALRLRGERAGKVVAIGPVVNKFIFQDALAVSVPQSVAQSQAELSAECSGKLRDLLRRTTPNPDRQHPEISATLAVLAADTEARVRAHLDAPCVTGDSTSLLREIYDPVVGRAVLATTRGSPLRVRESVARARAALDSTLKKLTTRTSDVASDHKKKGPRKKKGGA
jgi:hypothetical protein